MMTHYLRYHLFGILVLWITNAIAADNIPIVVINSATSPKTAMSQGVLGAIFGMRMRKWDDGSPIKVFVLPDENPLHAAFTKNVLHVFPYQLRSAWDRLVFSGTGEQPIEVKSEQQMRVIVNSTPGAIGYLSSVMIDETVKIIPVE